MARTKPMTTKNLAKASPAPEDTGEESTTKVAKPVPSQAKVDDVREGVVAGDVAVPKAKKGAVKSSDPYPSQAELDAIKDGTFKRDMRAEGDGTAYKTR